MIDHVELWVGDVARAGAFFRAALAPLGYALHVEREAGRGFGADPAALDFWLRSGGPSAPLPHVAFNCTTRATVDAAYAAARAAGGADNGAPKLLPHLHANYYAGFVLDHEGHNIEFVCHTPD